MMRLHRSKEALKRNELMFECLYNINLTLCKRGFGVLGFWGFGYLVAGKGYAVLVQAVV